MRAALISAIFAVATSVAGQPTSENLQAFPDAYPEAPDIVSNWDGGPTFRIGQVIFAYDSSLPWRPVEEGGPAIDGLPPVAEVVRTARPTTGLRALIDLQLQCELEFVLEGMTLHAPHGEASGWWIYWNLYPTSVFGATGIPHAYTTAVSATNVVAHPDCYLIDECYWPVAHQWHCSTLKLPTIGAFEDAEVQEEDARQIATKKLSDFVRQLKSRVDEEPLRMKVQDIQQVELPLPTSDTNPPETRSYWAVKFKNESRTDPDHEHFRLTIWVAPDGRPSDLRVLVVGQDGSIEVPELFKTAEPDDQ
jgi:hypothetical protein